MTDTYKTGAAYRQATQEAYDANVAVSEALRRATFTIDPEAWAAVEAAQAVAEQKREVWKAAYNAEFGGNL